MLKTLNLKGLYANIKEKKSEPFMQVSISNPPKPLLNAVKSCSPAPKNPIPYETVNRILREANSESTTRLEEQLNYENFKQLATEIKQDHDSVKRRKIDLVIGIFKGLISNIKLSLTKRNNFQKSYDFFNIAKEYEELTHKPSKRASLEIKNSLDSTVSWQKLLKKEINAMIEKTEKDT